MRDRVRKGKKRETAGNLPNKYRFKIRLWFCVHLVGMPTSLTDSLFFTFICMPFLAHRKIHLKYRFNFLKPPTIQLLYYIPPIRSAVKIQFIENAPALSVPTVRPYHSDTVYACAYAPVYICIHMICACGSVCVLHTSRRLKFSLIAFTIVIDWMPLVNILSGNIYIYIL